MIEVARENPIKYIELYLYYRSRERQGDLQTDDLYVLLYIKAVICIEKVTRRQLEGVPVCIIQRSLKQEHD